MRDKLNLTPFAMLAVGEEFVCGLTMCRFAYGSE